MGRSTLEVNAGGSNTAECSAETVGLTLADGKHSRDCGHLIQGHTWEPLQDVRARRLLSLFGTVEVRAPRFLPCRCAVTRHHTLNPVAEIIPDRCVPEHERMVRAVRPSPADGLIAIPEGANAWFTERPAAQTGEAVRAATPRRRRGLGRAGATSTRPCNSRQRRSGRGYRPIESRGLRRVPTKGRL
jgi:hypothetical protein